MLVRASYEDVHVAAKRPNMKVWHLFAEDGFAYILSVDRPEVEGQVYVLGEIPHKFIENPNIYYSEHWYKGHFWWLNI